MKKIYVNAFCVLYKFWEKMSYPKISSDWKAEISIISLGLLVFFSIDSYYFSFTQKKMAYDFFINCILLIFLIIINHFLLVRNDKWKYYLKEFANKSRQEKLNLSIIVLITIILIISNFAFSTYLMEQAKLKTR